MARSMERYFVSKNDHRIDVSIVDGKYVVTLSTAGSSQPQQIVLSGADMTSLMEALGMRHYLKDRA